MTELARVESLIRAGVERAKAAGKHILPFGFNLTLDEQGRIVYEEGAECCCLISPLAIGKVPPDPTMFVPSAAEELGIDPERVWDIIFGFDSRHHSYRNEWSKLGARLGREFVDGVE